MQTHLHQRIVQREAATLRMDAGARPLCFAQRLKARDKLGARLLEIA